MSRTKLRQHFAKTLGYSCFTMMGVLAIWKGDLDRGMSAGNCLIGCMLFFVGLASITYEPSAAQRTGKAESR